MENEQEMDTLTHPVFGELRWEEPTSWWLGDFRLESGDLVEVMVVPGRQDRVAFLEKAAQLFQRAMGAEPRIRGVAAEQKVLELYECWRNEDEPILTARELAERLELVTVRIGTVVPISLGYIVGDGLEDVFGGHGLDVRVDESLGVTDVGLVG